MKIGFHLTRLGLRGNTNAVFQYAKACQSLLGYGAVLLLRGPEGLHLSASVAEFRRHFEVFLYGSTAELDQIVSREQVDLLYSIKPGWDDGIAAQRCPNAVHAMNSFMEPHGECYAFVSEWQSQFMSRGRYPHVPHIVTRPSGRGCLRSELGIPTEALVIGRHGGDQTFDIPFVQKLVENFAAAHPETYFLFLNTKPFCSPRSNLIFLPGIFDLQYKDAFISSCDAMLHARARGETFGLAVAEFAIAGKRVLTWAGSVEKAHFAFLDPEDAMYADYDALWLALERLQPRIAPIVRPKMLEYSAENVMSRFKAVFIDGPCQTPARRG
ncbi:MAG: hypothetical protein K1X83_11375 [Oligoflexia bacterium]|nr:hypothetical protein [Oligoflexia bacterium]